MLSKQNKQQKLEDGLLTVSAAISTLRKVEGNKQKGELLLDLCIRSPVARKLLRAAYKNEQVPIEEETLPENLAEVLRLINTGNLRCGVSLDLFNKVMEKGGWPKINKFLEEQKGICFESYLENEYIHCNIFFDGRKAGSASFIVSSDGRDALFALRNLGVKVVSRAD